MLKFGGILILGEEAGVATFCPLFCKHLLSEIMRQHLPERLKTGFLCPFARAKFPKNAI
jgi:hypothetical protein